MSSTEPTPDNDYHVAPGDVPTDDYFNAVFGSIGQRLRALELTEADYQAAIDQITTQALAIISANITEEVEAQRANLVAIQQAADNIVAAYEAIAATGLPASSASLTPIEGFAPTNAQAAIEAILALLSGKAGKQATDARLAALEDYRSPFTFAYAFR